MTNTHPEQFGAGRIDTPDLLLAWEEAPWDSRIFGAPVLQVTDIAVRGSSAHADTRAFVRSRDALGALLVSCRLAHDRLPESMMLESIGFRFIEMVFQPELELAGLPSAEPLQPLTVEPARDEDLTAIEAIAASAFTNERFHADPRLPRERADQRYRQWARSSHGHASQRLMALREDGDLVAFFVTEQLPDATCYWHLTAVAPSAQGRGIGRRAWQTMLARAKAEGAGRVRSSIAARNHRVLNLYASLGFRFPPPRMTFHWVSTP